MFIHISLRDCKCEAFQDVTESLGIKGQRRSREEASFPALSKHRGREGSAPRG